MKEFPAFADGVEQFAKGYWELMRKQEESVLPLAQKVLGEAGWASINLEFVSNRDSLASERENQDFQKLFSKIVSLAPPAIGVGPKLP